jgi:hypothetical protein
MPAGSFFGIVPPGSTIGGAISNAILPVLEPVIRFGVHLAARQEMRMYQGASNFSLIKQHYDHLT